MPHMPPARAVRAGLLLLGGSDSSGQGGLRSMEPQRPAQLRGRS